MNALLIRLLPWKLYRFLWRRSLNHHIEQTLNNPAARKATDPTQPTVGYWMWIDDLVRAATTKAEFWAALARTPLEYAPVWQARAERIDQRQKELGYRYWNYRPGQDDHA